MRLGFQEYEDLIFIQDQNGTVDFDFSIISVHPSAQARMTSAPVENGQMRFDGKIPDPWTLDVKCIVTKSKYGRTKARVEEMLKNVSFVFYSVHTRLRTYSNLALKNVRWEETNQKLDAVEFTLSFQEVLVQGRVNAQTMNEAAQYTTRTR